MSVFWLRLAAALYSVGLLHALVVVLKRSSQLSIVASRAFSLGVTFHLVSLVERSVGLGHLPADNFQQTASLLAFLMALAFQFVAWKYQFQSVSVFVFPLVFMMALVATSDAPIAGWADQRVRGAWLLVHVALVMIGYSAVVVTAIASIFYLIQERQLKSKKPGLVFTKLPPLSSLDTLISNARGLGFAFITLGTIVAMVWAFIESGSRWIGQPQIAISLLTWAFYLVMVFLRASAGWRGRKAAFMSLAIVGFSAITWAAHVGLRPLLEK